MNLLLDTSIIIQVMQERSLSDLARREIDRAATVFVSSVSTWEISIKVSVGKLRVDVDRLITRLGEAQFEQLAITWQHGRAVRDLPLHHRDPFDRMLVAQAMTEPLRLLTHDQTLTKYSDLVVLV